MTKNQGVRISALLTMILYLSGCAAAVVGAAGAVGGIAYSDRGAKGELKGDTSKVNQEAQKVFKDMGIKQTATSTESSGQERTLDGKTGTMKVSVEMKQQPSGTTQVEVIAREGTVKWNKDYAKDVLAKIAQE